MAAGGVDIGSLLAGLGAGGVGGAPGGDLMGGMGGPPQASPGDAGQDAGIPDLLKQALDLVTQAYQKETDPLDKEAIGKIMSLIDQVFAQEQKDKDQALGGASTSRLMRRNR